MLDRLIAAPFALGSRLRGARVFHPRGVVVRGTWRPVAGAGLLDGSPLIGAPRPVLLRLSHAVGLPPGWRDIVGLAVRVTDAHGVGRPQDLLFASSGTGTVGRHLLRPVRRIDDALLSTLLPYDVAGRDRHPLVARAVDAPAGLEYADVAADPAARMPSFEICVGGERPERLAVVEPGEPVPSDVAEQLCFDPWHTGPELRPAGLVNRLRHPTYAASQRGRGAA